MNKDNLQRIIKTAGIAFSLFFAVGIFSTAAQAQNRNNQRNDDNQYRRDDRDNDYRYENNGRNRNDDYRYENNRRNRNNDNNIYRGSVQHGYRDGLRQGAEMPETVIVPMLNERQIAKFVRQPETIRDQPRRIIVKVLFEDTMKAIIVTAIIVTTIITTIINRLENGH